MDRNTMNEMLDRRGQIIGTWVQSLNPDACELVGRCGIDFVLIDLEHGSMGWEGMAEMIRATDCGGATVMVRLPDDSPTGIKKALDAGAAGILIPSIRTAA